MAINFKENYIHVDMLKMTFHEFEQKLFSKSFCGKEIIESKILTNGKKIRLMDTKIWEISQKILLDINSMKEFSEQLKKEIDHILEF